MFVVWVVEAEKGRHLLKILFSRLFKKRRGCCYIIEEEIDWFHSSRNLEGCLAAITNPRMMSLRSAGPVIHKWGLEVCWPLSLLTLCGPGSVEKFPGGRREAQSRQGNAGSWSCPAWLSSWAQEKKGLEDDGTEFLHKVGRTGPAKITFSLLMRLQVGPI